MGGGSGYRVLGVWRKIDDGGKFRQDRKVKQIGFE